LTVQVSGLAEAQTQLGVQAMKVHTKLPIVVAVLALLLCSEELASAQQRRKILVAYVAPGITQTVPWVTKEAGIFTKHGIDAEVILLTGSPRLVQTLLAGDVDYALGGVSSVLRARFHGADPVILATTTNYSGQRVLLRPESPLQRLQMIFLNKLEIEMPSLLMNL
jgi:ABC-type nitrate/sulfonate/bicarbonate transport system substrate-binding protein